jgi:hypothetical protein
MIPNPISAEAAAPSLQGQLSAICQQLGADVSASSGPLHGLPEKPLVRHDGSQELAPGMVPTVAAP